MQVTRIGTAFMWSIKGSEPQTSSNLQLKTINSFVLQAVILTPNSFQVSFCCLGDLAQGVNLEFSFTSFYFFKDKFQHSLGKDFSSPNQQGICSLKLLFNFC